MELLKNRCDEGLSLDTPNHRLEGVRRVQKHIARISNAFLGEAFTALVGNIVVCVVSHCMS